VKLRTYTYIHARDVSFASAASSSALCGIRRGKFIYSRRSVFNPDARFDARLRETPDPKRALRVCVCMRVRVRLVRTNSNDMHTGYATKKKLINRVLIFDKLGSGLFFNGNLTEKIIRRINLIFLKI